MRGKLATVVVLTVAVAACSTEGTAATAPASTSPVTVTTTTAVPPATTTTTTMAAMTTLDRRTEIEAIFQDLEERRLRALSEGDREAFQTLFANPEYMTRSMGAFDAVEFVGEPGGVMVDVVDVLRDSATCIAAILKVDATQSLGPTAIVQSVWVLEPSESQGWGYSFGGEGWICEGPHPFSR